MSASFDKYLGVTGNRDKVMAIVQFLPLMLHEGASSVDPALGKKLASLGAMSDAYRAITRLGMLVHALAPETLHSIAKPQGDVALDRLDQLSHGFHLLYCVFENSSVLASHGALSAKLTRLGGCAVTCWFYTLTIGLIRTLYVLTQKPLSEKEKKAQLIVLLKTSCFFVFAMTCVPAGGPQLLENPSGPLLPVHNALRFIAPKHLALNDTVRGALGLVASICDFY